LKPGILLQNPCEHSCTLIREMNTDPPKWASTQMHAGGKRRALASILNTMHFNLDKAGAWGPRVKRLPFVSTALVSQSQLSPVAVKLAVKVAS
jgi:hypothetical protein